MTTMWAGGLLGAQLFHASDCYIPRAPSAISSNKLVDEKHSAILFVLCKMRPWWVRIVLVLLSGLFHIVLCRANELLMLCQVRIL